MNNISVTSPMNRADIQNPNVYDSNPVEKASLPAWSMPTYVSLNVDRDEKNGVVSQQQAQQAFARILSAFQAN
ncbi:MAG TPA: hypothetical protein ACHBZ9_21730 [Arsenophonus nasoniae]|uniref:hypothetical protein n=1 Tax=Arsenophonus nasoniae TaxID=638 RepID=UPI0038794A3C